MKRILGIGALLLVIFFSGCSDEKDPAVARKKIVVATDATLIPMSFINDQQKIDGFEADLMFAIAKEAGLELEMINVEWAGLFGGLITRKFDAAISSITILDERKERMAFSIPYLQSGIALVVRKETQGVQSLEDLKTKNLLVGAQVGTTAYFLLEKDPAIRKKGYQLYGHAIADLIKGEVDAVVGESTGTLYYKNQKEDYFSKIKMAGEIMTKEYYGIVLRKEDKELLETINRAVMALLENGTAQKLHDKWELGKAARVPKLASVQEASPVSGL